MASKLHDRTGLALAVEPVVPKPAGVVAPLGVAQGVFLESTEDSSGISEEADGLSFGKMVRDSGGGNIVFTGKAPDRCAFALGCKALLSRAAWERHFVRAPAPGAAHGVV